MEKRTKEILIEIINQLLNISDDYVVFPDELEKIRKELLK